MLGVEAIAATAMKTGVKRFGAPGVGVAMAGVAVLGAGPRFVTSVPEGHVALLSHWDTLKSEKDRYVNFVSPRLEGEIHQFYRKGRHFIMPFVDKLEAISVQDRNSALPHFKVVDKDDWMYDIDGQLKWGVVRETDGDGEIIDYGIEYPELIYRALTKATNIEEMRDNVVGESTDALRAKLHKGIAPNEITTSELLTHLDRSSELGKHLLSEYGVEVRGVSLTDRSMHWAERVRGTPFPPAHIVGAGVEGAAVFDIGQQRPA